VIGVSVYDRPSGRFEFREGPVFANFVLCDEINRASPKTQSALLEAMEERQVTVDGHTHRLPQPFVVLATQNPLEHEGTYSLPESQLDRFLVWTSVGYPDRAAELAVLDTHGDANALDRLIPVASVLDVSAMIHTAQRTHAAQALKGYVVDLAHASRRHPRLRLGMSPRASLAVLRLARARAAATGRAYVLPDDVQAVLEPALGHRLLLTPEAVARGTTPADVIRELVGSVAVPSPRRA
jgi:MoxR-like ATPase